MEGIEEGRKEGRKEDMLAGRQLEASKKKEGRKAGMKEYN